MPPPGLLFPLTQGTLRHFHFESKERLRLISGSRLDVFEENKDTQKRKQKASFVLKLYERKAANET